MLTYFTEDEENAADLNEAENREIIVTKTNEYNHIYGQHPRSVRPGHHFFTLPLLLAIK